MRKKYFFSFGKITFDKVMKQAEGAIKPLKRKKTLNNKILEWSEGIYKELF